MHNGSIARAASAAPMSAVSQPAIDFDFGASNFDDMTLAHFPELKRLSRPARLRIAEELWDSAASDDLPVPASHKTLIRERRETYARGAAKTLTMAELKRSIRRQS